MINRSSALQRLARGFSCVALCTLGSSFAAGGTVVDLVKDIDTTTGVGNVSNIVNVGGAAYFTASDGSTGVELWRSNGTSAGTILVADINPGAGSSNPQNLTAVGSVLYFTANDGTTGVELWKSDGTAGGTVRVADISPG